MSMDNNITAKEAREQLLEIWTNCKFGVKELVKKEYSHRTIHYILSTEAYSDTDKILAVIETINQQVGVVKNRVNEMDEKIKEINKKV